jgi:hypothetical protein
VENLPFPGYDQSVHSVFSDERETVFDRIIENGLRKGVAIGTFRPYERHAHDGVGVFSGFRIDDVVVVAAFDLPLPLVASGGGDRNVSSKDRRENFSRKGIFDSNAPPGFFRVRSGSEDVAPRVDEKIGISKRADECGREIDGVAFANTPEIQRLPLAKSYGIPFDRYGGKIDVRASAGRRYELSGLKGFGVPERGNVREGIESAFGGGIRLFAKSEEFDEPRRYLSAAGGI